jgi:hypothetical protein
MPIRQTRTRTQCIYFRKAPCSFYPIKNVLIQWDSPDVEIIQRFYYLGVEKVDPVLYEATYGPSLVDASQLPPEAFRFPTPRGEVLACDSNPNISPYLFKTYIYQDYNYKA